MRLRAAYEELIQRIIQMQQEPGCDWDAVHALEVPLGELRARLVAGEDPETDVGGDPEPKKNSAPPKSKKPAKKRPAKKS